MSVLFFIVFNAYHTFFTYYVENKVEIADLIFLFGKSPKNSPILPACGRMESSRQLTKTFASDFPKVRRIPIQGEIAALVLPLSNI